MGGVSSSSQFEYPGFTLSVEDTNYSTLKQIMIKD